MFDLYNAMVNENANFEYGGYYNYEIEYTGSGFKMTVTPSEEHNDNTDAGEYIFDRFSEAIAKIEALEA